MKMEFLDVTGNGKYPNASPKYLVRLSEFSDNEQKDLIQRIEQFLENEGQPLELHYLSFIQPINCAVTLKLSEEDMGLENYGKNHEYSCLLSISGYQQMIEIIKNIDGGHNWLTPGEYLDEPAFLLSRYGPW